MKKRMYYLPAGKHFAPLAIGLLAIIASACPNSIFAQKQTQDGTDWIKDATVEKVTFYHKIINCNNQTVVLLKFNNAGKSAVRVSWENVFNVDGKNGSSKVAGTSLVISKLTVAPGTLAASGCTDEQHKELIVRSAIVDPTRFIDITGFEFKNPAVTTPQ